MLKKLFVNTLVLIVFIFSFASATYAQKIYFSRIPLSCYTAVQGLPLLKLKNTKKLFDMVWLDFKLPKKRFTTDSVFDQKSPTHYPDVAICYVNEAVGYGLYAMQPIQHGSIIAVYTGEDIRRPLTYGYDKKYVASVGLDGLLYDSKGRRIYHYIDAKKRSNVARFALHAPTDYSLKRWEYRFVKGDCKDACKRMTAKVKLPQLKA